MVVEQRAPVAPSQRFVQTSKFSVAPKFAGHRTIPTGVGQATSRGLGSKSFGRTGIFGRGSGSFMHIRAGGRMAPEVLLAEIRKAKKAVLREAAFRVYTRARRMLKTPINNPSDPLSAPHRHSQPKNRAHSSGLQRSILFGFDEFRETGLAGPSVALGPGIPIVARRHEFGGTASNVENKQRTIRRLGGVGEIRRGGKVTEGTKTVKVGRMSSIRRGSKSIKRTRITYTRLRTSKMVREANKLNEQLYGPLRYSASYPKRRFMHPAMMAVLPQFPGMWGRSITR